MVKELIRLSSTFNVVALAFTVPCNAQLNGVPMWSPDLPSTTKPLAAYFAIHGAFGDDFVGSNTKVDWGATIAARRLLSSRYTVAAGLGLTRRDIGPGGDRRFMPQLFISGAANFLHWTFGENLNEVGVSAVGGYGYSSLPGSAEEQNFTAGVDVRFVFWILEPWISPRVHWRRTTLTTGNQRQHGPVLTAGALIGLNFAALVVAMDYISLGAADGGLPETNTFAVSLGIQLGW